VFNYDAFVINIAKTSVFRGRWVDAVATYALFSESICMLLLIIKEKIGLVVTFFVLISFSLYILFLRLINAYEICGCGGILNGLTFQWHIVINLLLITSLTYLFYQYEKSH
jgi:hypothetical protein